MKTRTVSQPRLFCSLELPLRRESRVKVLMIPCCACVVVSSPAFVQESRRGRCNTSTAEFFFFLFPVADMRKALSRDTEKKSIIPLPHPVRPEDIE